MNVSFDADEVIRVFRAYPVASARRLLQLMEGAAIDTQGELRRNAPVFDGQYRRSVQYRMNPAALEVEIKPTVNYAVPLEKGARPHWTSVRQGTPLRKWADAKGINPWAVQNSIATKGTKGQHVVKKTFATMKPRVEGDIVRGISKFVEEVNQGNV
jgi:hypothetical protein